MDTDNTVFRYKPTSQTILDGSFVGRFSKCPNLLKREY